MTRHGLSAAKALGTKLSRFRSAFGARRALFAVRDRGLAELRALDATASDFVLDTTPGSLLALERWYFTLFARRGFARLGTDRARFEVAMGLYFGAVAVRRAKARWVVEEFPFAPGTYELGITRGLSSIMGIDGLCGNWHARPRNKTHRALEREYAQSFAPAPRRVAKPPPSDADIEAEVLRLLGLKSSPQRFPWELERDARDKLGATKTTLPGLVFDRVLAAMEKRKRIARVGHGRTGRYAYSYALVRRSAREK